MGALLATLAAIVSLVGGAVATAGSAGGVQGTTTVQSTSTEQVTVVSSTNRGSGGADQSTNQEAINSSSINQTASNQSVSSQVTIGQTAFDSTVIMGAAGGVQKLLLVGSAPDGTPLRFTLTLEPVDGVLACVVTYTVAGVSVPLTPELDQLLREQGLDPAACRVN